MSYLLLYVIPACASVLAVVVAVRWGEWQRRREEAASAPQPPGGRTSRMAMFATCVIVAGLSFLLAYYAADRLVMYFQGHEVQATVTWLSDTQFRSKRGGSFGTESRVDVATELEYEVNGSRYKVRTMCHDNPPLEIGGQIPLKVHPYDPNDYLVLRGTRDQSLIQYQALIIGLGCLLVLGGVTKLGSWVVACLPRSGPQVPAPQ